MVEHQISAFDVLVENCCLVQSFASLGSKCNECSYRNFNSVLEALGTESLSHWKMHM